MSATATILKPTMENKLQYEFGETDDIIKVLLEADKVADTFTKKFAPSLRGKSVVETCSNIHAFVLKNIPYKLDPKGVQYIKSPGRLWADKAGDCKSFSLFAGSILKNLGIPYGYRFVSFSQTDHTPTHVYVYVPNGSSIIIIDPVWNGPFNTEKKFTFKKDILIMPTKIYYLGNADDNSTLAANEYPTVLNIGNADNLSELNEGVMDLLLAKQKINIDEQNAVAIGGTWKRKGYQSQKQIVQKCLNNQNNPEVIEAIGDALIGKGKKKAGKFIKKVGAKIKKGVKAVTKVATAPMRLIAKGILEIYLPKAAFFFIYLFANANVLPDKMKAQRAKAQKFKDFIVKKIGMKDAHFMSIIRNNLTKRFGKAPEAWLADRIKGTGKIAAIGYLAELDYLGKAKPKKAPPKKANPVAKKKVNKQKASKPGAKKPVAKAAPTLAPLSKSAIEDLKNAAKPVPVNPNMAEDRAEMFEEKAIELQEARRQGNIDAAKEIVNAAATGNLVGVVMSAINWIIQKLGGKKAGISIDASDMPDIEADNANAFEFKDLKENYNDLQPQQLVEVKAVVTDVIKNDMPIQQAEEVLQERLPYLSPRQRTEMLEEVEEGFEPTSDEKDMEVARVIREEANINQENNGGGSRGWC